MNAYDNPDSLVRGRRVAVLGAGVSGLAAGRLVRGRGGEATLFDESGENGEPFFDATIACDYDAVVVSPGFAADHRWRLAARSSGLPVFGETGFAARFWKGPLYGITGTNGKTTLTRLIESALLRAGRPAVAAGNIGWPLADAVLSERNDGLTAAVCEISSFQSEMPAGLRLDGLIWSNFDEDHLDRYGCMDGYFEAKARLFPLVGRDAPIVLGPTVADWARRLDRELPAGARVIEAGSVERASDGVPAFARGFQRENFALASALWEGLGFESGELRAAGTEFAYPDHRLAKVAEHEGVQFWNDSKATNFAAALAAVSSFDGPVFWIAGGRSKQGNLGAFAAAVAGRVAGAFVYGEVADRFGALLAANDCPTRTFGRLAEAVAAAGQAAAGRPGAVVLLSPGFASFDAFSGYAERGNSFNSQVFSLYTA